MTSRAPAIPTARDLPRWLVVLALGSMACAVVVLFGVWPLTGADLVLHLTVGNWIMRHRTVPRIDPFSYISEHQEFLAHSWLSEVTFHLIEQRAGTVGFMLLRFALIGVALTFAVRTAQRLNAQLPVLMLLAPVVLGLMWGRLELRPQLFTSALLAAQLWLIMSVHTGRRSSRGLWALPPLSALSINVHGGWIQSVATLAAITAALVVMEIRRRWLRNGATSQLSVRHLALVLGACVLALFVNPYGLDLITFPLQMEASWIRAGPEWQSPLTSTGWRLGGGGVFVPVQPVFFGYTALLGGTLLTQGQRWRTVDLVPIAMMGLWLAFSLWHLRVVADAALLTSPFVAASLPTAWGRTRIWPAWAGIVGLIGLTPVGIWGAWQVRDWRWSRGEPRCVEAAVERLGRPARVFGSPITEWLLYRLPDRVQVHFFWEYAAGQQHTAELRAIWQGRASLGAYLEHYQVDVILLNNGAFRSVPLLTSMGWTVVHLDDRSFLMVPQRPDMAAIIQQDGYHVIRPWDNAPVTAGNARRVLAEAERALRNCPDGASFAWAYQARALQQLGRPQEAFEARLKVPEKLVIE